MTIDEKSSEKPIGYREMKVKKMGQDRFRCQVRARNGQNSKLFVGEGPTPLEAVESAVTQARSWEQGRD